MNTRMVVCILMLLMRSITVLAEITIGNGVVLSFASVAEGNGILTSRDDFVERMSPFDRAARLKTDRDVSESEYLEFVGRNILAWDDVEKQKINAAFNGIQGSLKKLALPFPEQILLIKTTGREEGGAAYTRANAIVLTQSDIKKPMAAIQKLICHELFHILSRTNPELRTRLYAAIGFVPSGEVEFPPPLKSRKITNPDAPKNDHVIRVNVAGQEHWAIPILFSNVEKYDVNRGGEFFNYLQFKLLLVERSAHDRAVTPIFDGREPRLVDLRDVSGFFEQVGKNTGYIIHPEEILADNFALLVLGQRNLPSPHIVEKIGKILASDTGVPLEDKRQR